MRPNKVNNKYVLLHLYIIIMLCMGCSRDKLRADQYIVNRNQLYHEYLEGDARVAQRCLLDIIKLLEQPGMLVDAYPNQKVAIAGERLLTYSRLHVLETRVGNKVSAEAYLLKAHYWLLVKRELSGVSTEEAISAVHAFTSECCGKFVIPLDNAMTQGKGPKYAQNLSGCLNNVRQDSEFRDSLLN